MGILDVATMIYQSNRQPRELGGKNLGELPGVDSITEDGQSSLSSEESSDGVTSGMFMSKPRLLRAS